MNTLWSSRWRLAAIAALFTGALSGCVEQSDVTAKPSSALTSRPTQFEPQPLQDIEKVVVSSAIRGEIFTPLFLGEYLGEFEEENISIEFVTLPAHEALPALAQGSTDVAASGLTAPFFNLIHSGADITIAAPGAANSPTDGLWMTKELAEKGPGSLVGQKIGISSGTGSPSMAPIGLYLSGEGLSLRDVEFVRIPIGDLALALSEGLIQAAWLHSPEHLGLDPAIDPVRVVHYAEDNSHVAYVFGPNLIDRRPNVGRAFLRALHRTTERYLAGDYKSDPEVISALSKALDMTEQELRDSGTLSFPQEFNGELLSAAQNSWLDLGEVLEFDDPIQAEDMIMRVSTDQLRERGN